VHCSDLQLCALLTLGTGCDVFHAASDRAYAHISVDPQVPWETTENSTGPTPKNRRGTRDQVDTHIIHAMGPRSRLPRGTWSKVLIASMIALFLQWSTTGAAIIVVWFTPTSGGEIHYHKSFYANMIGFFQGLGAGRAHIYYTAGCPPLAG